MLGIGYKGPILLFSMLFCANSWAACSQYVTMVQRSNVSSFLLRPVSLLEQHPRGGKELADKIYLLTIVDPTAVLPQVLAAARSGNLAQKEDIGRGLARSYLQCIMLSDQSRADYIGKFVANNALSEIRWSYEEYRRNYVQSNFEKQGIEVLGRKQVDQTEGRKLPIGTLPGLFDSSRLPNVLKPIGSIK